MKYFLVGYMGSGKTYCGREMAKELGIPFVDLDAYISMVEQRPISDLFNTKGEAHFRTLETRYLHEVCKLFESFVMSTGGGTPCFNGNMDYMNEVGHTIFVDTDIDTILQRLLKNKRKRPMISHLKDSEVRDFIEKHLNERMSYYTQAKEVIHN
ncbi:shikimate kinase [Odoribacter sp. OttesenSCG-928-J03]|nr:shikimate kinase [Odoribacter sp. OttesenSCG-928-J03]MDL2331355.1 shikimate kinase [Odoribacter sp. OttesenSCG-928-A06]